MAMDALGIECTLHGLRHTHVSQLIAAGLDVLTISRRLGHCVANDNARGLRTHVLQHGRPAAEISEAAFAKVRIRLGTKPGFSPVAIRWQFPYCRCLKSLICRVSSVVEQRFCKPLVGGSSPLIRHQSNQRLAKRGGGCFVVATVLRRAQDEIHRVPSPLQTRFEPKTQCERLVKRYALPTRRGNSFPTNAPETL